MNRILAEISPNEHDLAVRWQRLPLPIDLPLSDGGSCRLLHAGRPGGPQGPDIRDAVLNFPDTTQQTGDVEFHVQCSDWYAHQHHSDPRYNHVILHIVLIFDTSRPILRQDGHAVPVCSLLDFVPSVSPPLSQPELPPSQEQGYPCERLVPAMGDSERAEMLRKAGMARFEEKAQNLLTHLREARPREPFSAFDTVLIPALAEALGYGRDRAFFRAAGLRLVGLIDDRDVPEPLGRAPKPSPLDAKRLGALGELVEQWRDAGAWETIRKSIVSPPTIRSSADPGHTSPDTRKGYPYMPGRHPAQRATMPKIEMLRSMFASIGAARADILICNVILPFATAVALLESDSMLEARAREVYERYPALASNQVTRTMRQQLHLEREPRNACQQQGLQHIYAQTCREKRCEMCLVARWRINS